MTTRALLLLWLFGCYADLELAEPGRLRAIGADALAAASGAVLVGSSSAEGGGRVVLVTSDGARWPLPTPTGARTYGSAVTLNATADRAAVADSTRVDPTGFPVGSVTVLERIDGSWQVRCDVLGSADRLFGRAVAMSPSGDRWFVGLPSADSAGGAVAEWTLTPSGCTEARVWRSEAPQFGHSVAVSGELLAVGSPSLARGRVDLFSLDSDAHTVVTSDRGGFGHAIAFAHDTEDVFVVGAPYDVERDGTGSVHRFRKVGSRWVLEATPNARGMSSHEWLGFSVAATRTSTFAGAPASDAVFEFDERGEVVGVWTSVEGSSFGTSIAFDGFGLWTAAPGQSDALWTSSI